MKALSLLYFFGHLVLSSNKYLKYKHSTSRDEEEWLSCTFLRQLLIQLFNTFDYILSVQTTIQEKLFNVDEPQTKDGSEQIVSSGVVEKAIACTASLNSPLSRRIMVSPATHQSMPLIEEVAAPRSLCNSIFMIIKLISNDQHYFMKSFGVSTSSSSSSTTCSVKTLAVSAVDINVEIL